MHRWIWFKIIIPHLNDFKINKKKTFHSHTSMPVKWSVPGIEYTCPMKITQDQKITNSYMYGPIFSKHTCWYKYISILQNLHFHSKECYSIGIFWGEGCLRQECFKVHQWGVIKERLGQFITANRINVSGLCTCVLIRLTQQGYTHHTVIRGCNKTLYIFRSTEWCRMFTPASRDTYIVIKYINTFIVFFAFLRTGETSKSIIW